MRILVLCSGNIGRSPLGEVLLRHYLGAELGVVPDNLDQVGVAVASAGTNAPTARSASPRGVAFAASRGLDLTEHTATQLTREAVSEADVIYCMDRQQVTAVLALDDGAASKTRLLAGEGIEIPDPHHESDGFFLDVAQRIERAVVAEVPRLLATL